MSGIDAFDPSGESTELNSAWSTAILTLRPKPFKRFDIF